MVKTYFSVYRRNPKLGAAIVACIVSLIVLLTLGLTGSYPPPSPPASPAGKRWLYVPIHLVVAVSVAGLTVGVYELFSAALRRLDSKVRRAAYRKIFFPPGSPPSDIAQEFVIVVAPQQ